MTWRIELRPEVETDVSAAAGWYNRKEASLGSRFVEAVIEVWDALAENPLLNSKRDPEIDVRWRMTERFPYRVVYRVSQEQHSVLILAVLHGARSDESWRGRLSK